jgi:hypothetical protein
LGDYQQTIGAVGDIRNDWLVAKEVHRRGSLRVAETGNAEKRNAEAFFSRSPLRFSLSAALCEPLR